MYAVEVDNLHKSYDTADVLRGLTLRVADGQVYGLLGPNGSGKSTLMHLLLGFLRPERGQLRVLGAANPADVVGRVGYLPERLRYHLRYTGREYLRYLGRFSGLGGRALDARIGEELRSVGLLDAADRMLSTYSRGMLQRLGVAQALLHDPALLLFDEPTSGLDPAGQREMLDLLAALRGRGRTTLMATHYLDEAEHLCDRIGVLYDGQLAAETDAATLRAPGRSALITVAGLTAEQRASLEQLGPAVRCSSAEVAIEPNTPALQAAVVRALLDAEVPIIALEPRGRPLEELYLRAVSGAPQILPPLAAPPSADGRAEDRTTAILEEPPARPGPPRAGDTLLRELLRREGDRSDDR